MTQKILIFVLLLVLALLGYKMLQPKNTTSNPIADVATDTPVDAAFTSTDLDDIPPTYVDSDATSTSVSVVKPVLTSSASSFTCDGRKHCSQMTSCAEATYFVQHCPNTKMDGNNDGIPCEQQWCR
ncbi:excalibur calcium-binding domain-containing protein [Psychrobacter cibarius]|uniref:excalibur calcium-binding domain-containing protein n=1 Tax=Psychrobacter cibarius TaxID=282669 RepID=UPI001D0FC16B